MKKPAAADVTLKKPAAAAVTLKKPAAAIGKYSSEEWADLDREGKKSKMGNTSLTREQWSYWLPKIEKLRKSLPEPEIVPETGNPEIVNKVKLRIIADRKPLIQILDRKGAFGSSQLVHWNEPKGAVDMMKKIMKEYVAENLERDNVLQRIKELKDEFDVKVPEEEDNRPTGILKKRKGPATDKPKEDSKTETGETPKSKVRRQISFGEANIARKHQRS